MEGVKALHDLSKLSLDIHDTPFARVPTALRCAEPAAPAETEEASVDVAVAAEGDEPPESGAEALETNVESESDSELKTTESDTI